MTRRITSLLTALGLGLLAAPAVAKTNPVVSEGDAAMIQDAAQDSLEFDETAETTEWVNPDTGNYGTITPTGTYETEDGTYCREYHQTVTIGGKEQEAYGTACRAEDGSWEIARDEPEVRTAEPEVVDDEPPTVVYRDRVVYVREPWYGYPLLYPFAWSIGIGLHNGYSHHYGGHHYSYSHYATGYRSRSHGYRGHSRGWSVRGGHRRGSHFRHSYRH